MDDDATDENTLSANCVLLCCVYVTITVDKFKGREYKLDWQHEIPDAPPPRLDENRSPALRRSPELRTTLPASLSQQKHVRITFPKISQYNLSEPLWFVFLLLPRFPLDDVMRADFWEIRLLITSSVSTGGA